MFKDLKLPSVQKDLRHYVEHNPDIEDKDRNVVCNLVDILFRHVLMSIRTDRSSVKLDRFTRGMIGGVLEKTKDGTKEYVVGMRNDDIKLLMDDIEKELTKRNKEKNK